MVLAILKIIVAIYGATKLIGAKDPAKSFFDLIDFKVNSFLQSLKDESVRNVLWKLNRALFRVNIVLFVVFVVSVLLFTPLPREFVLNWTFVFMFTLLLNVAIPWNLDHIGFLKKYFFKSPLLVIPAAPVLALSLGFLYGIDFLSPFKSLSFGEHLFSYVGGNVWLFAVSLSAIFLGVYIVIPYIQFWIILFPLFYIFVALTYIMQLGLRVLHRYVNENLLAVIMGVLAIILAVL